MENGIKKINGTAQIDVWDLPTRLFHWLLVLFVVGAFVSANIGSMWMDFHEKFGAGILILLIFRVIWGFSGSKYARFSSFLKNPSEVFQYSLTLFKKDSPRHLGHNPLGGWSIIAMIVFLFTQVVTGLFSNDDILFEGPLFDYVTKETSDLLTRIHLLNRYVIIFLIAIHVAAILFHLFVKRENLIKPMITGTKEWKD